MPASDSPTPLNTSAKRVAVIGGGPAGLMAAEVICAAGYQVDLYDSKASVGRKFLIAGKGGLNLTHSEDRPVFDQRYNERALEIERWLDVFDAEALRAWARGLGVETFVGSSGRVFPQDMKAAPLLRGWVRRLHQSGVRFHQSHRWLGFDATGESRFATADGEVSVHTDATVLAMGGGSWAKLGSDGAWFAALEQLGIDVAPLVPSNCGFEANWSTHLIQRFAGAPLKSVALTVIDDAGTPHRVLGEFVLSEYGIEGSAVYALSSVIRDQIAKHGYADVLIDLSPHRHETGLREAFAKPSKGRSLADRLRRIASITDVKAGLLFEVLDKSQFADAAAVARCIKRLPIRVLRPRPIDEAISTAGGVRFAAMNPQLMLNNMPGVFCAGEMIDWEAPTGGYLLTASFASGVVAGRGVLNYLSR